MKTIEILQHNGVKYIRCTYILYMYVLINQIVVINIKIMMTTSEEEGEGEILEQLVTLYNELYF